MVHNERTFGNRGSYCEVLEKDLDRQLALQQTPHVNKLGHWLEKEHGGLSSKVERAFKQWNIKIRDQLRTETGLRISIDSMQQTVPVHIVPGFPEPLSSIIDELGEEFFKWQIKKPMLTAARHTLNDVKKGKSLLDENIEGVPAANEQQVDATLGYIDQIIAALETFDLLKRVSSIDTDFLGAYYFRIPRILLYWMAIGFVARLLNVSPEALTVVVAAHEFGYRVGPWCEWGT